jgi:hypothetical protein
MKKKIVLKLSKETLQRLQQDAPIHTAAVAIVRPPCSPPDYCSIEYTESNADCGSC